MTTTACPSAEELAERINTRVHVRMSAAEAMQCTLALALRQREQVITLLHTGKLARQLARPQPPRATVEVMTTAELGALARLQPLGLPSHSHSHATSAPGASAAAGRTLQEALQRLPTAAQAVAGVEAALATTTSASQQALWAAPLTRAVAVMGVHSTDPDGVLNTIFGGALPRHDARRLHQYLQSVHLAGPPPDNHNIVVDLAQLVQALTRALMT